MRRLALSACTIFFIATPSFAQWVNKADNSAFGAGENAISEATANGYALGFECARPEDAIRFATNKGKLDELR